MSVLLPFFSRAFFMNPGLFGCDYCFNLFFVIQILLFLYLDFLRCWQIRGSLSAVVLMMIVAINAYAAS